MLELGHGREVHRLVGDPVVHRPVPHAAHHHPLLLQQLHRQRGSRGDPHAPAHDRVGPQVAHPEVGNVHPPAPALAVPGLLAQKLGDRAVDVVVVGRHAYIAVLLQGKLVFLRVLHELPQGRLVHLQQGVQPLVHAVPVAPVGAGDVVLPPEHRHRPHRGGLLPHAQVRGPPVLVARIRHEALHLQVAHHVLHVALQQHRPVQPQRLLPPDQPSLQLLAQRRGVAKQRDFRHLQLAGPRLTGQYVVCFHPNSPIPSVGSCVSALRD